MPMVLEVQVNLLTRRYFVLSLNSFYERPSWHQVCFFLIVEELAGKIGLHVYDRSFIQYIIEVLLLQATVTVKNCILQVRSAIRTSHAHDFSTCSKK